MALSFSRPSDGADPQPPVGFQKQLTVGEVAARSGVAVSTLHFYESEGLIKSWRNRGNQRRYPREVLRRVAVIRVAQRTGMPLKEIREAFATLPDERTPTAQDWQELSKRWRAELSDRIERLTRLRDQLDGCIGCGCLSLGVCPLRNPWDKLSAEGPGPRLLDPGLCDAHCRSSKSKGPESYSFDASCEPTPTQGPSEHISFQHRIPFS